MAVYKDNKRNTWYVSYKIKDTITGKFKHIKKRGFETKKQAQLWESENKPKEVVHTTVTFREMLQLHLNSTDATETTRYMKIHWLEKHFNEFMDLPMDKITRNDLLMWRNNLKEKGLATRTMNRGIQYIKSVCAFAYKIYNIPDNSVILNSYKLVEKDKQEMNVWTIEEFNKFIDKVYLEEYKAFYTFLFWTGCRRGEAIALCKEDIQGNIVTINKSMRYIQNGFKNPKNDSSKRKIKIDDKLATYLKPFVEKANPFIFGGTSPLTPTQIDRYFNKAIKESGVKRIRIHDLRHSHATILINNGVNIVAVSKRLGHSTINQTLKTYTHLLQETNDELLNKIEELKE